MGTPSPSPDLAQSLVSLLEAGLAPKPGALHWALFFWTNRCHEISDDN